MHDADTEAVVQDVAVDDEETGERGKLQLERVWQGDSKVRSDRVGCVRATYEGGGSRGLSMWCGACGMVVQHRAQVYKRAPASRKKAFIDLLLTKDKVRIVYLDDGPIHPPHASPAYTRTNFKVPQPASL